MKENSKEYQFTGGDRIEDPLLIPITDLPWSELSETVLRKSGAWAKRALEEAGFNTVGEVLDHFEERHQKNIHGSGIGGFGLGSFQAVNYLLEPMGLELPRVGFV